MATELCGAPGRTRDLGDAGGGWHAYELWHPDYVADEPVKVKRVLYAEEHRLRPAYVVELLLSRPDSTDARGYRHIIAADDGEVLSTRDLTVSDTFNYKVWADGTRRPLDAPQADF